MVIKTTQMLTKSFPEKTLFDLVSERLPSWAEHGFLFLCSPFSHRSRQEALCEQQETCASSSCALANQLAWHQEGQMHMNMEHRASFFCSVCQAMNSLIQFCPQTLGVGMGA